MSTEATSKPVYNVKNPYIARLKHKHDLTAPGAVKHTAHFEIDLTGSGLEYTPGDSLAVLPTNDPALVSDVLAALGFSGDGERGESEGRDRADPSGAHESFSITDVDNKLLKAVIEKTGGASAVTPLVDPEKKDDLKKYLWGREVIDVLVENPAAGEFEPAEFIGLLKKLIIRLYSISSSQRAVGEQVHLTVATVKYESHGRARKVCAPPSSPSASTPARRCPFS